MASIPKAKLRADINALLDAEDLSKLSAKTVRKALEEKYELDLSNRKKEIDAVTMELLKERSFKEEASDDDHDDDSSDGERQSKSKQESDDSEGPEDADDVAYAKKVHREENKTRTRAVKKEPSKKRARASNGGEAGVGKKRKTGFTKDLILSQELAAFMGKDRMPRCDVVKAMWAYIKDHNLKDPKDGRFALLDEPLQKIFKKNRIQSFSMMKYLSEHLTDPDKV